MGLERIGGAELEATNITTFLFIYFFFRERGREGKKEGEKRQCVVASCTPPTGDLTCNPGMCPDWESNWQPLGSQASIQSTEAPQSGLTISFKDFYCTGEGMMWVMTAAENGVKYCFCLFVL